MTLKPTLNAITQKINIQKSQQSERKSITHQQESLENQNQPVSKSSAKKLKTALSTFKQMEQLLHDLRDQVAKEQPLHLATTENSRMFNSVIGTLEDIVQYAVTENQHIFVSQSPEFEEQIDSRGIQAYKRSQERHAFNSSDDSPQAHIALKVGAKAILGRGGVLPKLRHLANQGQVTGKETLRTIDELAGSLTSINTLIDTVLPEEIGNEEKAS